MTVIKGTITDATGQPLAGATLTFTALQTTAGMLKSVATYITTGRGEYEFTVTPGVYSVSLSQNGANGYVLGSVHIYDDSPDGTLNSFLNAKNIDTRPEALRQFATLVQQAETAATTSASNADSVATAKEEATRSATEAKDAATRAEQSATNATQSEQNAKTSETAAALHEQSGVTHETNAGQSAAAAALSEQNAAGSAAAAGTAKDDAVRSATEAKDAATQAAQSAANAGKSATEAAGHATDAQQALKAAQETVKTPHFITPKGDISRWVPMRDSLTGTAEWKVTQGSPGIYQSGAIFNSAPWEIQHLISSPGDLLRYGGGIRFFYNILDNLNDIAKGTDLLEVRLMIPDEAVPAGANVPPATPDKPYLVAGLIARHFSTEKIAIYYPDDDVTASPQFYASYQTTTGVESSLILGMVFNLVEYRILLYDAVRELPNIKYARSGVYTPPGILCIRSGNNPVSRIIFNFLESSVLRENPVYRLTPEDNGATFYCPLAFTDFITLPDAPLPEGFSVKLISEEWGRTLVTPENNNVAIDTGSPNHMRYSTGLSRGIQYLTQIGKNGKEWLLR
ncbi:TPA: prophage tail fiber N-terminal domain-containing protein [Salmonella enterica subsp. enterica serovar Anatum]